MHKKTAENLQVASAYSKAKGAGVNLSSCCKQRFPPVFYFAHRRNSLKLPDCTVYLPCWVLVKGLSEKPGAFLCWVLPRNVCSVLSHATALGGGELTAPPPECVQGILHATHLQDHWDVCQVHISSFGHPVADTDRDVAWGAKPAEKGKFFFTYLYKFIFQGNFKRQALNPQGQSVVASCWKRDLEWVTCRGGDHRGKASPGVCAAQFVF